VPRPRAVDEESPLICGQESVSLSLFHTLDQQRLDQVRYTAQQQQSEMGAGIRFAENFIASSVPLQLRVVHAQFRVENQGNKGNNK
jgi:hypothetical protein